MRWAYSAHSRSMASGSPWATPASAGTSGGTGTTARLPAGSAARRLDIDGHGLSTRSPSTWGWCGTCWSWQGVRPTSPRGSAAPTSRSGPLDRRDGRAPEPERCRAGREVVEMDATIGSNDTADVVVVGAGLAGLAAAAVAAGSTNGSSGAAAGGAGRRASDEQTSGDGPAPTSATGSRFNQGPRALYRGGQARAVLGRLGLEPEGGPRRPPRARTACATAGSSDCPPTAAPGHHQPLLSPAARPSWAGCWPGSAASPTSWPARARRRGSPSSGCAPTPRASSP